MMRLGLAAIPILGLTALPVRAESPGLAKARAKVEAFELDVALELLDVMLEDKATSREERTAAFALKGRVLVGYGCNTRAVANYHALLRHAPGFELPATESPKVRQCFDHARATAPPPPPPKANPEPNPDPEIEAAPLDPNPVPGPLDTPPPPEEKDDSSVLTSWWLWTGVAGVATITVVLSVVLATSGGEEPIRGDLGHATNWPP